MVWPGDITRSSFSTLFIYMSSSTISEWLLNIPVTELVWGFPDIANLDIQFFVRFIFQYQYIFKLSSYEFLISIVQKYLLSFWTSSLSGALHIFFEMAVNWNNGFNSMLIRIIVTKYLLILIRSTNNLFQNN